MVLGTCLAVGSTKLCYLTGAADLTMGMGLADKIMGTQTTWMQYALHNFVPGMLYTAMSLAIVLLAAARRSRMSCAVVQEKYRELGVMAPERNALWLWS